MAERRHIHKHHLTLEIAGPSITADKFALGVSSFLAIIKDVAKQVVGAPKAVRWLVGVEAGSVRVHFFPEPVAAQPQIIPQVLDTIETGIAAVESGSTPPPNFSEHALSNARRLASILDGGQHELDRVQIWRDGRSHSITTRTVANVDALFGIQSRDWGTIEGRLQTITERRGLRFIVYDPVTNRGTTCHFDDEILDDVTDAFGRRVSVSGLIRYRGDGEPVSIDVEEFSVLPPDESLPGIEEVQGILRRRT